MCVYIFKFWHNERVSVNCVPYLLNYKPGILFPSWLLEIRYHNETGLYSGPVSLPVPTIRSTSNILTVQTAVSLDISAILTAEKHGKIGL